MNLEEGHTVQPTTSTKGFYRGPPSCPALWAFTQGLVTVLSPRDAPGPDEKAEAQDREVTDVLKASSC